MKIITGSSSAKSTTARLRLGRMKHIKLRSLAVQDWVQQRLLTVGEVTSDGNLSDILVKPKETMNWDDELVCVVLP